MSAKSKTIYYVIAVTSFALITSNTLFAQEWSAAQEEVWKNVETYWEHARENDIDGFLSYFHEDFSGWANSSVLPDSRDQRAQMIRQFFPQTRTVMHTIKPVAIKIHGDVAIVQYYYFMVTKEAGEEDDDDQDLEQGRWTDILKKQGDRWVMIGDHGGPMGDDDDD
jgi:ketosteroid isomerase-like protein